MVAGDAALSTGHADVPVPIIWSNWTWSWIVGVGHEAEASSGTRPTPSSAQRGRHERVETEHGDRQLDAQCERVQGTEARSTFAANSRMRPRQ